MRATRTVKVPEFQNSTNRDLGKTFVITEWPAIEADRWIQKVGYAVMGGGGSLPSELAGIGWEGIAILGINTMLRGTMNPDVMIPLCEQLLECVQIVPDPKHEASARAATAPNDIEEVATRWWLRDQVVSVHTNFSFLGALSMLASTVMAKMPEPGLPNTSTSPPA